MRGKKERRGFTIVELVIVIAVIAILATTLVPTFGDVIHRAQQAKDIQTVKNMNTALMIYGATMSDEPMNNALIQNMDDVLAALAEAGFDTAEELTPVCKDHAFYWHKTTNQIAYVDEREEGFDLVYPENIPDFPPTKNDESLENLVKEIPDVKWEIGTIAGQTGINRGDTNRLRTTDYLLLSDFDHVSIAPGYQLVRMVYDKDHKYINGSDWLGDGVAVSISRLRAQYPNGVYFRLALKANDGRNLTLDDLEKSGVQFYGPGDGPANPEDNLIVEDLKSIGSFQDGAIWNGKLFAFGGDGTGKVFDLDTQQVLGTLTLDKKDVLKPHANSVCFGSTYYAEGDQYPLLYVNIYNNYQNAVDRMEGTCCVYRLTEEGGAFKTQLVQVIRIGFVEDLNLWKSIANNGDTRPYGNFVVDTDSNKLYAFVMRDQNKTTRFFGFDIPSLEEGVENETYGCKVVTLNAADIVKQFDVAYFNYLQGCTYYDGKILSVEGWSNGALRVVDLKTEKLETTYQLTAVQLTKEPEVISVDPADGSLYYADAGGVLRKLSFADQEN